jgi:hypothetical protein
VAVIAVGGLAASVVAGCAGSSHNAARMSTATALVPVSGEVQHDVAKVWPQASRIWPGVVLKDRRIILGDGKAARLITVEGVTTLTPAKLAEEKVTVPAAGSLYTTWDGHPAVVLNTADPAYAAEAKANRVGLSNVLFGAATDELFHSWQVAGGAKAGRELRGTEYPLAVTPRLYRAMLYNDLLAAYRDPRQRRQRLAAAAYWNSRWEKEYPDEAKRAVPTDANEGAAGYFDTVASAMAGGADRENRTDLRENVPYAPLDQVSDPRRLTLDGEGGPLGAIAGLILEETRKGWQKQVTQGGQTPVGLLLYGVTPVAEQPSDGLRQSIQDVLAKQNSDLIPRFTPLVSAYHDTADPLLLVPLDSATGDLDAGGYYTTKDVPYTMLARLSGSFQLPTGTLRADQASVLTGMVDGHQYVIVPIDPAHHGTHVSNDRVELSTGTLTGTFQVRTHGAGGRERLVAQ